MNKKIETTEASFLINEMFVTSTDEKGIIKSGNAAFARVANYQFHEFIKKPHNMIRHPDMPKVVFRLFWQFLKEGKTIAAYVKNRSKDGLYYWVLATAFPVEDGFLSIRIKPPSEAVNMIENFYHDLLETEQKNGIDAAVAKLSAGLSELGYSSYEKFAVHALEHGLNNRDEHVEPVSPEIVFYKVELKDRGLAHMYEYAYRSGSIFRSVAHVFHEAMKNINLKEVDLAKVSIACDRLHYLAANMSITAQKLGRDGSALGVVAGSFQKVSAQVKSKITEVESNFEELPKKIEKTILDLYVARLQVDMLAFQMLEVLNLKSETDDWGLTKELRMQDCSRMISLVSKYFRELYTYIKEFYIQVREIEHELSTLSNTILSLDLIRTGGRLEGSRTVLIAENFGPFVIEMESFINEVKEPLEIMGLQIKNLYKSLSQCLESLGESDFLIAQLSSTENRYFTKSTSQQEASIVSIRGEKIA